MFTQREICYVCHNMTTGLLLAQRYQLTTRLGGGGMGSVWLARDLTLNADIAVKLIHPEHIGSPEAVARFRREAQAAAAIRSTHVIQILDYGVESGTPYIAMERLTGESLSQRLMRLGKFSPEQMEHVLGQVARALAMAHERGIVHRDVKPDNIFLVREGNQEVCKVLDFGIAHRPGETPEFDAFKTQTGAILGTPYYMSPEQATGQSVDCLTDIWSFGVIALECLLGKRPFRSDSLGVLFHAICVAPLPVPSQLGPVPAGFDAWFARAAARDKTERFQSIQAAAHELKAICGRSSGQPFSLSSSVVPVADALAKTPPATLPAGSAASAIFPGFQYTTRLSPAGGGRRRAGIKAAVWLTVPAAAVLAIALLYAQGWNRGSAAATSSQLPSNGHLDDFVAPTVNAATNQVTAPIELADAGTADRAADRRPSLEAHPAAASQRRPAQVIRTKAPPGPSPTRANILAQAHDDNAAGI